MYKIGLPFWKAMARCGVAINVPVNIYHDDEADVYFATSSSLKGLAVEAPTLDELREEVRGAVDVLIELQFQGNSHMRGQATPVFSFMDRPLSTTV